MRLSVSCGAAQAGPGTETPEQLLRAADAAQYAAKRRGGSQFCTAAGAAAGPAESLPLPGTSAATASAARRPARWRPWTAGCATPACSTAWRRSRWPSRGRSTPPPGPSRAAGAGSGLIESLSLANDRDDRLRGLRRGPGRRDLRARRLPRHRGPDPSGRGQLRLPPRRPRRRPLRAGAARGDGPRLGAGRRGQRPCRAPTWWRSTATRRPSGCEDAEQDLEPARPGCRCRRSAASRSQRRSHHLEVISAITAALAELTDEQPILQATVDELQRGFGWPVCAVMRINDDHLELAAHASRSS